MKRAKRHTTGKASDYIVHFKKLLLTVRVLKVVLYCRVSRCQQRKNGNLKDQEKFLKRIIRYYEKKYNVKIDIVAVVRETASGWSNDRMEMEKAVSGNILVWNCPSRTMNPTLPQSIIDDAIAQDLQSAKSEYLGEFRDDVVLLLSREVIESVVVKSRTELLPRDDTNYFAFVDLSGGRVDDAALAIAHKENSKVVVDFLKRYKPPFNPHEVVRLMCEELKRYNIRQCTGDYFSAEFVVMSFRSNGVIYHKSSKPKSELYLELMPRICSGEIELIDDEILVEQLASLERRTRSGGRDTVDHPDNGHDDCANVIAGVATIAGRNSIRAGAIISKVTTRRRFAFG